MRAFCLQQLRLIALLAIAILWIVAFPMWSSWVTKNPLDMAISLSPQGSIREAIEIRIPERYVVQFKFERNGTDFNQLKKLIGAMGLCQPNEECSKGVPIPVRWSLRNSETGATVLSGLVESIDSNGWSRAHVYRGVGIIQVQPGRYVFEAEITRPVPELAHIGTHIAVEHQPKRTTTWQMGLVWWGSMGYAFLAWPAAVYAIALLIWRAFRTYRSIGRAA